MKTTVQSAETSTTNGQASHGAHSGENGQPWGIEVHAHESFGPAFKKSWHVEVELHGPIHPEDIEEFQRQVRRAFQACAQAVDDELMRTSGLQQGGVALEFKPASGNGAKTKVGPANEQSVEQLVSDLLADDEDLQSKGLETLHETVEAAAPPKKAPAIAKKPAAPPPKTKPKPADDEDAEPRVAVKYWVVLGAVGLVAISYFFLQFWGRATPSNFAAAALSASDKQDRFAGVVQLIMSTDPAAAAELRRVASKSTDPDVQAEAVQALAKYPDPVNSDLCLSLLDHPEQKVRQAAVVSLARIVGVPTDNIDKEFGFTAGDPPVLRNAASLKLQGKYKGFVRSTKAPGPDGQ